LTFENEAQQAKIDDEDGSAEQGKRDQMYHFDQGKTPLGGLHGVTQGGVSECDEPRVQQVLKRPLSR